LTHASPTFDVQSARAAVSIVSHGHGALVTALLADLAAHCGGSISVILTLNVPEPFAPDPALPLPVRLMRNVAPKGFRANHNAAFKQCHDACFCVLNPDIRLVANPFLRLIAELEQPGAGLAAPRIVDPAGHTEDSARRFPTPGVIPRKGAGVAARLYHEIGSEVISPDWVAGMFMLFRSDILAELQGFDERYFLYYEDVDLCRRLRARGYDVRVGPTVSAVRAARRESRRSLRHLRWHVASMLRYFVTRRA
jgi:GT2 family glycosyltransferase